MTYESHHSSFSSSVGSLFRARGAAGSRKSCVVDSSIHEHVGGRYDEVATRPHTHAMRWNCYKGYYGSGSPYSVGEMNWTVDDTVKTTMNGISNWHRDRLGIFAI